MYHVVLRAKDPNAGESSIFIEGGGEEVPERLNLVVLASVPWPGGLANKIEIDEKG